MTGHISWSHVDDQLPHKDNLIHHKIKGILHSNSKINSCEHHRFVFIQVDCCTLANTFPNINIQQE